MSLDPARRATSRSPRPRRALAGLLTSALAVTGALAATVLPAAPAAADVTAGLLGWWKLDETSGATAADSSGNNRPGTVTGSATWNAGDGFTFSGGANSSGNAIRLPDNLMSGLDAVTVDFDVQVDPALAGNWFAFNLGNTATYPNGTGYLFVTGKDSSNRFRATIAEAGYATEQSTSRAGGLSTGLWKHVTYTVTGGTAAAPGRADLYEDGVRVASSTTVTTKPSLIGTPDGTSTLNVLGRSAYGADQSFKGRMRDVRVYGRALTQTEATTRATATNTAGVAAGKAALSLGDTSDVAADLTLPATGAQGTTVTWATSDPSVVEASGRIHRPANGTPAATAELTATVSRGAVSDTRSFTVTVRPEELDDAGKARAAADAVTLVHPDDVRGNLTLPTAGSFGAELTWESADPAIVSDTGEVTRPAHGQPAVDVDLVLTATVGSTPAERTFRLHVQPMPAPADYEAYAFAYFTGESTATSETISMAASKGNDPLDYDTLNDGRPVLTSTLGEMGLRDPFLIRSHEGDRFYLLATDLRIFGGNTFGEAQESGSRELMVWESTDLVSWSQQRAVTVSSAYAGNTWAPEAYYDEESGQYVVYWASNLYPTTDESTRNYNDSYNRMMYATTRDFVTFSEARPWVDVRRGAGRGMIDATVVKDGDTFYRIIKDEANFTPRQEKSTDLLATVSGSLPTTTSSPGWQLVREGVGGGQPNPWGGTFNQGEGPTVFRDNEVDDRWYMFIDQPSYHGGQGYVAFQTDDIASGQWTSIPSAVLPSSPRHGTVIPVTAAELDTLRAGLQPELLVASVEDVAVDTRQGVAPALPAQVAATFGDGRTGTTPVSWPTVDPSAYAGAGTFTVTGTVTSGSSDRPVATVRVTDAADPTTTASQSPDGQAGWWRTDPASVTVRAGDDTGVDSVEVSVDGGPWTRTTGSSVEVQVTGDGRHTLAARATDTTGNVSAPTTTQVRVDATAPVSRGTFDAGRRVSIRSADDTSGVASVQYRLGSGPWSAYTGPVQVPAAGASVTYRATDVAGNLERTNTLVVPATSTDPAPVSLTVTGPTSVRYGGLVTMTVEVSGGETATGRVRVLKGSQLLGTATLVDGRATLSVASKRLGAPGTKALVVRYDGDRLHLPGETQRLVTVTPAGSTTSVTVQDPGTDGSGGVVHVQVLTDPSGVGPTSIPVVLRRAGVVVATRTVVLVDGEGTWELPTLAAGRYAVSARASAPGVTASTGRETFTVSR